MTGITEGSSTRPQRRCCRAVPATPATHNAIAGRHKPGLIANCRGSGGPLNTRQRHTKLRSRIEKGFDRRCQAECSQIAMPPADDLQTKRHSGSIAPNRNCDRRVSGQRRSLSHSQPMACTSFPNMMPAPAASFDCNKAQLPDELTICAGSDRSCQKEVMSAARRQAMRKADDKEQLKTFTRKTTAALQARRWEKKCTADVTTDAMEQNEVILLEVVERY